MAFSIIAFILASHFSYVLYHSNNEEVNPVSARDESKWVAKENRGIIHCIESGSIELSNLSIIFNGSDWHAGVFSAVFSPSSYSNPYSEIGNSGYSRVAMYQSVDSSNNIIEIESPSDSLVPSGILHNSNDGKELCLLLFPVGDDTSFSYSIDCNCSFSDVLTDEQVKLIPWDSNEDSITREVEETSFLYVLKGRSSNLTSADECIELEYNDGEFTQFDHAGGVVLSECAHLGYRSSTVISTVVDSAYSVKVSNDSRPKPPSLLVLKDLSKLRPESDTSKQLIQPRWDVEEWSGNIHCTDGGSIGVSNIQLMFDRSTSESGYYIGQLKEDEFVNSSDDWYKELHQLSYNTPQVYGSTFVDNLQALNQTHSVYYDTPTTFSSNKGENCVILIAVGQHSKLSYDIECNCSHNGKMNDSSFDFIQWSEIVDDSANSTNIVTMNESRVVDVIKFRYGLGCLTLEYDIGKYIASEGSKMHECESPSQFNLPMRMWVDSNFQLIRENYTRPDPIIFTLNPIIEEIKTA